MSVRVLVHTVEIVEGSQTLLRPTQDQAARWRQNFQKAKATAAQVQAELQKLDLLTGQDTAQRSAFSENGTNSIG